MRVAILFAALCVAQGLHNVSNKTNASKPVVASSDAAAMTKALVGSSSARACMGLNATMNATMNATVASNATLPNRPPGYRSAWDDCGGVGASATERMRTIAAGIKGWAKPRKFARNAAQDAGKVHPSGTKPGPGSRTVYPARGVLRAAREGRNKAAATLSKYR
eukprot:gnl/TRDRNA2_/TRDRNA2_183351_c0_seq1.p1 gnl/TRDRNA2_/TRDRNA2_183351_c0~~gnl/TRDRNA2_/TRDRNA2_183351_c0_seq1.p1  ORF type:complete len:181 (+),score=25.97 gnl/TRDRNA2_/TRDRNA2_183351_c0_seq1:53-544(+)